MIPMADNLNHSDVSVTYELITKKLQVDPDPNSAYFTRSKFMNDYRLIFDPSDHENLNVKGRFSLANFDHNQARFDSIHQFEQ